MIRLLDVNVLVALAWPNHYGLERSARDGVPATALRLEAFSEEHLQQRLIRDIALMGQKLEFLQHEIGQA